MTYMMALDPAFRERYAPGRLLTLASDTSSEHEETYEHARFLARFCEEHDLHFELITADRGYHPQKWPSPEGFYEAGNRIGSKSYPKTCTWNLKLVPFYKRLERILADDYGVALGRKQGLYEYVALTGKKIRVLIVIWNGSVNPSLIVSRRARCSRASTDPEFLFSLVTQGRRAPGPRPYRYSERPICHIITHYKVYLCVVFPRIIALRLSDKSETALKRDPRAARRERAPDCHPEPPKRGPKTPSSHPPNGFFRRFTPLWNRDTATVV